MDTDEDSAECLSAFLYGTVSEVQTVTVDLNNYAPLGGDKRSQQRQH